MAAHDPIIREIIATIASETLWANCPDRAAHTAPGRKAFEARFEKQVDPEGTLPPAERAFRAEKARKVYFRRLALKSVQAARARKAALAEQEEDLPPRMGCAECGREIKARNDGLVRLHRTADGVHCQGGGKAPGVLKAAQTAGAA